jgi:iron complex transport system permease protein
MNPDIALESPPLAPAKSPDAPLPPHSPKNAPRRFARVAPFVPWLAFLALFLAIVASLGTGAYPMSFAHAMKVLLHVLHLLPDSGLDVREITVIDTIRPPRILVSTFAGIALGLSGAALQGMMRNPLVGPDLVGVTSGAACGGVLAIILGLSSAGLVALSFCGGLLAMSCTFGFARLVRLKSDGVALILAGFFVGAFFMALVGLMLSLDPTGSGPGIIYWLLGSFRGADPVKLWMIVIPTTLGGLVLMGLRWRLNLLSLSDVDARSLGVNLTWLRWLLIGVVTLMVSAQVAVSGVIGWVGLIIPHCARMLVGPDHRYLIPTSAFLGGLFVLGLDDLTRSIVSSELPVSILAALVGTPVICFLFWKTQSKGWTTQ